MGNCLVGQCLDLRAHKVRCPSELQDACQGPHWPCHLQFWLTKVLTASRLGHHAADVLTYFSTHFFLSETENLAFSYRILQFSVLTDALTEPPVDLYESSDSHSFKGHTNVYGLKMDCNE